jgi:hypothetical protein
MMTLVKDVVTSLVETIVQVFNGAEQHGICGYQVGSTVRRTAEFPVDLDIWLVRPESMNQSYIHRIDGLLECMEVGKSAIGVVDASDEISRHLIQVSASRVRKIFPDVEIVPQFGIGPVPQPLFHKPVVYIQTCGPLSVVENAYFFNRFPFHGRCFLDLNRQMFGSMQLADIVEVPSPDYTDLLKWTSFLSLRALTLSSALQRQACLKKILLNYSAYVSPRDIYVRTDELFQIYLSKGYNDFGIERACLDIARRELPGLR